MGVPGHPGTLRGWKKKNGNEPRASCSAHSQPHREDPAPPRGAGLGTHRFCGVQRAQTARNCSLGGKPTPKSGQEYKGKGFHPGEDTKGELVGAKLSTAACRDLIYIPFIPTGMNPLKAAPSWEFRAGEDLDAPRALPNS